MFAVQVIHALCAVEFIKAHRDNFPQIWAAGWAANLRQIHTQHHQNAQIQYSSSINGTPPAVTAGLEISNAQGNRVFPLADW